MRFAEARVELESLLEIGYSRVELLRRIVQSCNPIGIEGLAGAASNQFF